MIRPRLYKIFSDLVVNRSRSLLVVASIAVGLFAVGWIANGYFILSEDMRASYAAINPANITVRAQPFNQDMVDSAGRVAGVQDAVGAHTVSLRVWDATNKWSGIDLKAFQNFDKQAVNKIHLVEGSWPPGDKEIAIDRYKLDQIGAKLGNYVSIRLPDKTIRKFKLTGVVQDQSIGAESGGGGFFLASAQGYIDFDSLDWINQAENFNVLYITAAEGKDDLAHLRSLAESVSSKLQDNNYSVYSANIRRTADHPTSTYVDAIAGVLFLLGLMVVFLSAFLITNMLSALLKQQTQQIGIMKTIGGRRKQIMLIYMALILMFSLISLALSLPTSGRAAYALENFLAGELNFRPQGYRTAPIAQMLLVFIAIVVPQAAGFFPIIQGAKISIQEALSPTGQENGQEKPSGSGRLSKLVRKVRRPLLIALRNAFRSKWRLVLTLITLTLGGAIFIATFNVRLSLQEYMHKINRYFIADVNLTMARPYRIQELENDIRETPGVSYVEAWATARCELIMNGDRSEESVRLLAAPAGSTLIVPMMIEGRWLEPGDTNAIAVNEAFLTRYPNLKIGDTIQLKVNGEKKDWVVVGVFQLAGKSGGYAAYTNFEYLADVTHSHDQGQLYRIIGSNGPLDQARQEALGKQIEAKLEAKDYQIASVDSGTWLQQSTSRGFNILVAFLFMMAALMAVVGSIGLTGTMSLNVMERTREIGVMRAIGASDRIITQMVLLEGAAIGLISWALACVAAIPISLVMSNGISVVLFDRATDFTFTPTGILVWLGIVAVLSVVASLIPARSAARLTVREVLAYE